MKTDFKLKRLAALLMVLVLMSGFTVFAAVSSEDIEQAWSEQSENENKLLTAEERIAKLEAQKSDSQAYLNELNVQLEELASSINFISEECANKQAELDAAKLELIDLQASADEQYQAMKIRIQYIYESGTTTSPLVAIFSADDFTDMLNRAEMVSQLNKFDREMLESYLETLAEIEEKTATLEEENASLAALYAELMEQRQTMQIVYETAYQEMQNCIRNLDLAQAEQAELAAKIQAQDEYINSILAEQYAAELAAAEAAAMWEATQPNYEDWSVGAGYVDNAPSVDLNYAPDFVPEEPVYNEPIGVAPGFDIDTDPAYQEPAYEEPSYQEPGGNMTYLGNFTLTAYCACSICCGQWASGYTASGTWATPGVTVAMGGVPFGTQLLIDGHVYIVEDRGTPYGHVDVFFNDHQEALRFGMRSADVYQVN